MTRFVRYHCKVVQFKPNWKAAIVNTLLLKASCSDRILFKCHSGTAAVSSWRLGINKLLNSSIATREVWIYDDLMIAIGARAAVTPRLYFLFGSLIVRSYCLIMVAFSNTLTKMLARNEDLISLQSGFVVLLLSHSCYLLIKHKQY